MAATKQTGKSKSGSRPSSSRSRTATKTKSSSSRSNGSAPSRSKSASSHRRPRHRGRRLPGRGLRDRHRNRVERIGFEINSASGSRTAASKSKTTRSGNGPARTTSSSRAKSASSKTRSTKRGDGAASNREHRHRELQSKLTVEQNRRVRKRGHRIEGLLQTNNFRYSSAKPKTRTTTANRSTAAAKRKQPAKKGIVSELLTLFRQHLPQRA
jgi:hypothetical protein